MVGAKMPFPSFGLPLRGAHGTHLNALLFSFFPLLPAFRFRVLRFRKTSRHPTAQPLRVARRHKAKTPDSNRRKGTRLFRPAASPADGVQNCDNLSPCRKRQTRRRTESGIRYIHPARGGDILRADANGRRSALAADAARSAKTTLKKGKKSRPLKDGINKISCSSLPHTAVTEKTYFFIASTCLATSSERSSCFFSRPSPMTKKSKPLTDISDPAAFRREAIVFLSSLMKAWSNRQFS